MKQNITIEKCKVDLINAAKKGYITQTKTAIKRASKLLDGQEMSLAEFISLKDEEGGDAFTAAWKNNQVGVVKFLLSLGCININKKTLSYLTPLMHVVTAGNVEIAKLIADYDKTDLTIKTASGQTATHFAAANGQTEILDFLLTKQPDVEQSLFLANNMVLDWAELTGRKKTVKFLLNRDGVSLEDKLIRMVNDNVGKRVKLLLTYGANPEATDRYGNTALHVALSKGMDTWIITLLVENGANLEATNTMGNTALHVALSKGYTEIAKLFIKKGANLEATDTMGNTVVHVALSKNYIEIAELSIKNGANLEATNTQENTALHVALSKGFTEIAKLFIKKGANVNATDNNGNAVVHVALSKNYIEIVELLIKNGANLEATNENGYTVVRVAVDKNDIMLVQLSLENGANIEAKRNNGSTPLHAALRKGDRKIVELLIKNGANVNATDTNGNTVVHAALRKGDNYTEIVKLSLENGANVNATNNNGMTVVQVALSKNYTEIVKLSLENGANVDVKTGKTILHKLYCDVGRPFNNEDTIELTFLIINQNKDQNILSAHHGKRVLDLVIRNTGEAFIKDAVKPFLLHQDFPQYFMKLDKMLKHTVKYYFNIAKIKDDYEAIEKMKEVVAKDLGIADLAQSIITNLSSEPEWKDSTLDKPCISYFLKHPQEWVDFVLFHKKIHNLRLQNKHGEADFIEQIIPQHLHLPKGNFEEVIGGLSIFLLPQKTESTLVVEKKVPQAVYFLIGQFLSVEDIQGLYEDYIQAKEKQIPNWKERQKFILNPLAIEDQELAEILLGESIITQEIEQLGVIEEGSYN